MKLILVVISLLAFLAMTGVVAAAPTVVDFSVLGSGSVDITTAINPVGYTLDGINFRYDDMGSGTDTAKVGASGISGSTFGSLIFDFGAPVTSLNFDFSLLSAPTSVNDALFITLKNNGTDVVNMDVPANFTPYDPNAPDLGGNALGVLAYNGNAFNQVIMFFSTDTPSFSVENISYTSVPEPATLTFLATGLLGLSSQRYLRKKRR